MKSIHGNFTVLVREGELMYMKRNVLILILTVSIFLILQGIVLSAERSVIVGFHQKPGPSEKALIHGANGIIKHTYRHISAMSVRLSDQAIAQMKKNKKVAYVEDDGIFMAVEPVSGDEYVNAWGAQHIGADVAHTSGNIGAGIRIAVIDTGIDYTHEDLAANYRGGYDFVFGDDDPFDDNSRSHGTHVAGVIGAAKNGIGVVGVAPGAELYAVKVLDGGGFGLLSWIIEGIEWAVDNQMDIINLSLEGPDFQSLRDVCDIAYDAGVIVIAAGGNTYGQNVRYPAAYDSVIAVSATDVYDIKAYFSAVGPEVELTAPGMNILSTVSGGGYNSLSGTSQAAPHVAGTAALFLSSELQDINLDGTINHEDVRQMLRMTAVDLGDQGTDPLYGFGLVNAAAAALPEYEPLFVTITQTPASPYTDAETVALSGTLYEITIKNNGLAKVNVDVFAEGVFQDALSSTYRFNHKTPQEATFYIDAAETDYDVTFIPYGKPGASADIDILINTQ
jgi:subtilisin